jgi:uncharacterized 2Fe-2S/4Fe-4S cluster protein (DUF4445 family)
MVKITCLPDGKTLHIEPTETILKADLRANIPHAHACGGRGKCTACRSPSFRGWIVARRAMNWNAFVAERLGFASEVWPCLPNSP